MSLQWCSFRHLNPSIKRICTGSNDSTKEQLCEGNQTPVSTNRPPTANNMQTKQNYITLPTKVHLVKAMVFTVVMYGYESWVIKKAECQRIDAFELWVLEKTLESPLDCKEIQPVHLKGDQSWVFIGRTDVETETPIKVT